MFASEDLAAALRNLSTALGTPVMLLLLVLVAVTIFIAGTLVAELFIERIRRKKKIPVLLEQLRDKGSSVSDTIAGSGFLKRHQKAIMNLYNQSDKNAEMQEALARRLLHDEQARNNRIVYITDIITKLGPMLGLLGTLIPLGPGLIALGQGDTLTLSVSLISAFDTTVAGLSSAAVAYVVSVIRRSWYENDISAMETVMECLLERG